MFRRSAVLFGAGGKWGRARVRGGDRVFGVRVEGLESVPVGPREAYLRPEARFAALGVPSALLGKLGRLGASVPTEVQAEALPVLFGGEDGGDVVMHASSGSGKSLAYMLPVAAAALEGVSQTKCRGVVVVPTRELAVQVEATLQALVRRGRKKKRLGSGSDQDVVVRRFVGAVSQHRLNSLRHDPPHIAVGTPQTLAALIPQHLGVGDLNFFILDEADALFTPFRRKHTTHLLAAASRVTHRPRMCFVSATSSQALQKAQERFLKRPTLVDTRPNRTPSPKSPKSKPQTPRTSPTTAHLTLHCPSWAEKPKLLADLILAAGKKEEGGEEEEGGEGSLGGIDSIGSVGSVVFCASEVRAEAVGAYLAGCGIGSEPLLASCSNRERARALDRFVGRKTGVLLATDHAARGIDLGPVDLVVHYDPVSSPADYVHRAGRTGRLGGAPGLVASLLTPEEEEHFEVLARKIEFQNPIQQATVQAGSIVAGERGEGEGGRSGIEG